MCGITFHQNGIKFHLCGMKEYVWIDIFPCSSLSYKMVKSCVRPWHRYNTLRGQYFPCRPSGNRWKSIAMWQTRAKMGKCWFNDSWLEDEKYHGWLQKTTEYEALQTLQKKHETGKNGLQSPWRTHERWEAKAQCRKSGNNCPQSDVCSIGGYCKSKR